MARAIASAARRSDPAPRPRPTASGKTPPGLVLIGVSTDGPRALEDVLPKIPPDFPWPALSMNVSIEAARAGAAGKGFMVIAREIRELASRAKAIASDAGTRIETLRRSITVDLESEADRREAEESSAFDTMRVALRAFAAHVDVIVRHEREASEKGKAAGETIGAATVDILSRIQFQDIVRQQLEQLAAMTAMVRDHLVGFAVTLTEQGALDAGSSLADKLDAQFQNYTMVSQRVAHVAAAGGALSSEPTAPLIEMF